MYKNVRKITKKDNEIFILNKDGIVVKLSKNEEGNLNRYAPLEKITNDSPEIVKELADLDILYFKNYKPKKRKINFDDLLIKAKGENPIYNAPIIAHLSITSRCNMQCKYCSVRKIHKGNSEELSTKDYKKIIKKLSVWGVFQIGLTGGEPTLRGDIIELANDINSQECACNMTTNGWYLNKQKIKELYEAGLEQSQVSLDSHIKKTHETLRNIGSYDRALKSLELLQDIGIKVGVDCVVSKNNISDIPDFIDFLADKKISGITLIKLKKGDLPLDIFKKLVPDYKEYGKLIADLCERENTMPEATIDCGSVCNLHHSLTLEEQKKLHSAGCPAGHTLISISPNGDIYPCAALASDEFRLGNALTDNLDEIWHKNKILCDLRNIKSKVSGYCKNCERLDSCRAGCRGIAKVLKGLNSSDLTCKRKEVNYG